MPNEFQRFAESLIKDDTLIASKGTLEELESIFNQVLLILGSIDQYVKFVPNLSALSSSLRPLLNEKTLYHWDSNHKLAFKNLILEF